MKTENEKTTVKIQSYQNIWNLENRVYTVFDTVLPTSVSISDFLYVGVIEVIIIIIDYIFKLPNLGGMGFVFKYVAIPYLGLRLLKYKKFDGKLPVVFFKDYIIFFFQKNKQYEFFREIEIQPESQDYIMQWQCRYRHRLNISRRRKKRRG